MRRGGADCDAGNPGVSLAPGQSFAWGVRGCGATPGAEGRARQFQPEPEFPVPGVMPKVAYVPLVDSEPDSRGLITILSHGKRP